MATCQPEHRSPAEVSFPNFLAPQVLSRVPLAIAGISQKPSRDYKSSFLIKKEFLTNQDGMEVQVKQTQAIANGLRVALPSLSPEPVEK